MELSAATPLWTACRTLLTGQAGHFFSHWDKAAATFDDEEVHDFRVASRRLREALSLCAPCLPVRKRKRVAQQVKGITAMLGDLRNSDEAFKFFSGLSASERAPSAQELDELLSGLRREREEAHDRLRDELSAIAPEPLRRELQELEDRPNLFQRAALDPFTAFAFFGGGAIMNRGEPIAEFVALASREEDGAAQHRLRIKIKKLRYRIEIMEPLIRVGYDELREVLKGYQDVLGKLHDIDVFREMVQQRVADGPGQEALIKVLARRRRKLFREFQEMLQRDPIQELAGRAKEAL